MIHLSFKGINKVIFTVVQGSAYKRFSEPGQCSKRNTRQPRRISTTRKLAATKPIIIILGCCNELVATDKDITCKHTAEQRKTNSRCPSFDALYNERYMCQWSKLQSYMYILGAWVNLTFEQYSIL